MSILDQARSWSLSKKLLFLSCIVVFILLRLYVKWSPGIGPKVELIREIEFGGHVYRHHMSAGDSTVMKDGRIIFDSRHHGPLQIIELRDGKIVRVYYDHDRKVTRYVPLP